MGRTQKSPSQVRLLLERQDIVWKAQEILIKKIQSARYYSKKTGNDAELLRLKKTLDFWRDFSMDCLAEARAAYSALSETEKKEF